MPSPYESPSPLSDDEVATESDRRNFIRIEPKTDTVELRLADESVLTAQVANLSLGGISLNFDAAAPIAAGDVLEVQWNDVALTAVIRWKNEPEDGQVLAGLEWSTGG